MRSSGRTYTEREYGALEARLAVVERDNEALASENARLSREYIDAEYALRRCLAARDEAEAERAVAAAERDALLVVVDELRKTNGMLWESLAEANVAMFSAKSERRAKIAPGVVPLFTDDEAADDPKGSDDPSEPDDANDANGSKGSDDPKGAKGTGGTGKGKKPDGRSKPRGEDRKKPSKVDWDEFEQVTSVVDHRLEDASCPACGSPLRHMGYDVIRTFEYVPAHIEVTEHRMHKYSCDACGRANVRTGGEVPVQILRADPLIPVPGTHAGASLMAHVIQQKYEFALPVYRIWRQLDQLGLPVTRQTLCAWVISAWRERLAALEAEVWSRMRRRPVLGADETTVQVLKEKDRKPESTSYMWVATTGPWDERPAVHFEYDSSRSGEVVDRMFGGLGGTVVVSDGYAAYDRLGESNSRCLTHIRRPFAKIVKAVGEDAARAAGSAALEAVERLAAVYLVENQLAGLRPDERARARLERVLPLLDDFLMWCIKTRPECTAGTSLAKAFDYAVDNVPRMVPYIENGLVPIDNNGTERSIRPFTIGRKNWLFSDTVAGAEASAGIYSIVESARKNGLNPGRYVEWLLVEIARARPSEPSDWDRLMPWSDEAREACALRPGEQPPDVAEALAKAMGAEAVAADRE